MAAEPAAGTPATFPWERPLGARPIDGELTEFRVWAPKAETITLLIDKQEIGLADVGHGVYEARVKAPAGTDYQYVVNGKKLPDPASRHQPRGLRGPSRVATVPPIPSAGSTEPPAGTTATRFKPKPLSRQVIYELHIGTFSPEGTFTGAIPYLEGLAELGVTAIEVMPIGEFPGPRGWGYDGLYTFAAQSSYGGPDDFRTLVEAAHDAGLAVILDVVYNHVGPGGDKALGAFGPYFTSKYETPWGWALNYDDADSDPVREWACQNAEGWVRDFGVDGLRLDAIHAIFDSSPEHLVAAIARRVHAIDSRAMIIAESALNDPRVVTPERAGGWGCDASWADDFHHALRTLITDEHEGYYAEFGSVADLAKAYHRPYVFDGNYSSGRRRRFGAPADGVKPERFVVCDQNHDQVGNRAFGDRLPDAVRPVAAMVTLFSAFTPMLFMGEEYGEQAPFQFFCAHIDKRIAEATRKGRRAEFAAFASFGHDIPDPMSPDTFEASKLTRVAQPELAQLYRDLLALRPSLGPVEEIAFSESERWLAVTRGERQLVVNFGEAPLTRDARGRRLGIASGSEVLLGRGRLTLGPISAAILEART